MTRMSGLWPATTGEGSGTSELSPLCSIVWAIIVRDRDVRVRTVVVCLLFHFFQFKMSSPAHTHA